MRAPPLPVNETTPYRTMGVCISASLLIWGHGYMGVQAHDVMEHLMTSMRRGILISQTPRNHTYRCMYVWKTGDMGHCTSIGPQLWLVEHAATARHEVSASPDPTSSHPIYKTRPPAVPWIVPVGLPLAEARGLPPRPTPPLKIRPRSSHSFS